METKPQVTIANEGPIRSLSVDKGDLRRLLEKVQERCHAAAEIEVARYAPVGVDPEVVEQNKKQIREGFELFVSITGVDGAQVHGGISTMFDSPNFPSSVKTVLFDSGLPLRNKAFWVHNRCSLLLDFSRPGVLNFSFMPSQETPNASNIDVQGHDATWVNGVFHEVTAFIRDRPSALGWLHRHSVYDVLLWVLGFPFGFWACYRASDVIERFPSEFLQAAAYLYLFLAAQLGFRLLFHYARWIWPLLEYRHPSSKTGRHKAVWIFIAGGVFVNLLSDLIKAL